jgi:transposase-like protein
MSTIYEAKGIMEAKKRKVHSAEFKATVALDAVRGACTIAGIARQYDVHPVMVSQWKQEILTHASALFMSRRGRKALAMLDAEPLVAQIARLQTELDLLKKKAALQEK